MAADPSEELRGSDGRPLVEAAMYWLLERKIRLLPFR